MGCKSLEFSVNHILYNNKALLMAILSYKEPEGDTFVVKLHLERSKTFFVTA